MSFSKLFSPVIDRSKFFVLLVLGITVAAVQASANEAFRQIVRTQYSFQGVMPVNFGKNPDEVQTIYKEIVKGSKIQLITYQSLLSDLRGNVLVSNNMRQFVYENTAYEEELIKLSYSLPGAPEVSKCRAYDSAGNVLFESDPITGSSSSVNGDQSRDMTDQCAKTDGIFLLEVVHTHPFFELYYGSTLNDVMSRELSPGDRNYVVYESKRYPNIVVRTVVVVPNGYHYQTTFRQGIEVADPFSQ